MKNHYLRSSVLSQLGTITFLILVLASCSNKKKLKETGKPQAITNMPVTMVSGFGRVEPLKDMIKLSSEVDGIVVKKVATEGDTLAKGDTILVLNHAEQKYKVEQLEAQLETQRYNIRSLKQQVQAAQINFKNKQKYYQRLQKAYKNHAESLQNVDNAQLDYKQARSKNKQLYDQFMSAKSTYKEIKAELNQAKVNLSRHFIRALANGTILNMNINEGSYVKAYQTFGDFAPAGSLAVKAEVDELFANDIKVGQNVVVRLYGQQDTVATGKVVYVAPSLSKKSIFSDQPSDFEDRRVRKVTIALLNHKPVLIGARVYAFIQVNK